METLILGWYVLVSTGSVQQLVVFASLTWLGTIFSPFFGVAGDRIGIRRLLCVTRGIYALLASLLMLLTLNDALLPWHVYAIFGIAGLLRPSDMGMRYALVGQTMQPAILLRALSVSRTTSDTAKVAGALTGTAGVALIGIGPAYVVVTMVYVAAFLLSLGVAGPIPRPAAGKEAAMTALASLKQGLHHVWNKPELLGATCMAFLVNLLAFPLFLGLLPYAARDVFGIGQTGLGYLAAAFALGALAGSLVMGSTRAPPRAGRVMLWSGAIWFVAILLFGQTHSIGAGLALLFVSGFAQSYCLTPLAGMMLRATSEQMRGRVMGIRMLAIWGLPLGLLAAGPLIDGLGYAACTVIYGGLGLAATIAIGHRWRQALWH